MYLQSPFVLSLLGLLAVSGLVVHNNFDYFAKTEDVVNGPLVYGIIILLHSVFGASGITEKPQVLDKVINNTMVKFFVLLLLAFAAVRDFEDTIFVSVLFLAITQLLRNKEERKKHPYIL
jgi:hypothetical protein